MAEDLTKTQLFQYLEELKKAVCTLLPLDNVVFLNSKSLYLCFQDFPCGKETIGKVLKKIEDCIPLCFTNDSFSLFLTALAKEEGKKTEHVRQGLIESCKTDFLLLLFHSQEKEAWQSLLSTCDGLRQKNLTQVT